MYISDKWSMQYDKCLECNTSEHKHKAKGLCTACYQKLHSYPLSLCSSCGSLSRVHKRINGEAICRKCYEEPMHTCFICNKQTSAAYKLNSSDFVCDLCYTKHYRAKHQCSICNNTGILAINSDDKKICVKCYTAPNNMCSKCGRHVKSPYVIESGHVCSRCYENIKKDTPLSKLDNSKESYVCSICDSSSAIQRVYNDHSSICQSCAEQQPNICNLCANPLLPIHSHLKAIPYCRQCYYKQKFLYKLSTLKNNWSITYASAIEHYFEAKAQRVLYETLYEHLSLSTEVLNDIYYQFINSNSNFLTCYLIELIKKYPSRKLFINDFLAYLCSEKVVPDYENGLALLNNLDDQIEELPIKMKELIAKYKESLILKLNKFREKGWIGKHSRFSFYTCYLYCLTALRFLTFAVTSHNIQQPTEISNHTIDGFLKIKPYDTNNLRHFISFINRNKVTFISLSAPLLNYRFEFHISISEEKQKHLFETCLYDNNIKLRDRIILLLMLLYGFTPKILRFFKKNNFTITKIKNKTLVTFHNNSIKFEMPHAITPLVLEYLNNLDEVSDFVFPGRYINTAISLSSICSIMKNFKVTSKELYYTAINNALLNGLCQPAILMKYIGVTGLTATKYFRLLIGSEDVYDLN